MFEAGWVCDKNIGVWGLSLVVGLLERIILSWLDYV